MRLFVGVPLAEVARDAARDAAAPWRAAAPRLKWVDAGLYHLTLRFLGDCSCEAVDALGAVARAVEALCRRLGHAPEMRPFRAHLTLARARRGESLPPALAGELAAPPQPAWRASEVLLFESVLGPGGPEYRRVQCFACGGDAATRKDGSTA